MSKPIPMKVSAPVRRRPHPSTDKKRLEENRTREGLPSLTLDHDLQRQVWQILDGAVAGCSDNDFGRPWPRPRNVGELIAGHDRDLVLAAAKEAREIVQAQDRAPNITGLFEKKLRELAEVRATVRGALAA